MTASPPGAVSTMQKFTDANQAGLVGGDCNIQYSQSDTDDVKEILRASAKPLDPSWPQDPAQLRDSAAARAIAAHLAQRPCGDEPCTIALPFPGSSHQELRSASLAISSGGRLHTSTSEPPWPYCPW